jgi:hypothetical protein
MKLTTNDGENDQRSTKKWARGDSRGILTDLERKRLEQGTVSRHQRYNIETKARKAVDDLSLIFSTHLKPFDVRPFTNLTSSYNLNGLDGYIQDLILIQYKLHYQRLERDRKAKGVKRKVQRKEVLKIINKTIRDAKKNL